MSQPASPGAESSLLSRRLLAGVVGVTLLAGVLSVSLANALISVKLIGAAAALPMGSAIAARSADFDALSSRLAAQALRESTLVQPALTRIALDAPMPRSDMLLTLSGKLGWRDAATQRALYRMALRHGDCPAALASASALMRQGVGFAQLAPMVTRAAALPACQPALLALLHQGEPWAAPWLRRYGSTIPSSLLLPIMRIARPGRETWAPIVDQLLASSRGDLAHSLWQQAGEGGDQHDRLDWPGALARQYPTSFDWNLSADMDVTDGKPAMLSPGSGGVGIAVRRLMLTPGMYLLATGDSHDATQGWRWSLSCTSGVAPAPTASSTEPLRLRQIININARCSFPWLTLTGGEGPITAPALRRLRPAQ